MNLIGDVMKNTDNIKQLKSKLQQLNAEKHLKLDRLVELESEVDLIKVRLKDICNTVKQLNQEIQTLNNEE